MASIYTRTELVTLIKAIDLELNEAISHSEIDTGQTDQQFTIAIARLEKQRDYYYEQLGQLDLTSNKRGIITLVNKL